MKAKQLIEALNNLDQTKRIKFQNAEGWSKIIFQTMCLFKLPHNVCAMISTGI